MRYSRILNYHVYVRARRQGIYKIILQRMKLVGFRLDFWMPDGSIDVRSTYHQLNPVAMIYGGKFADSERIGSLTDFGDPDCIT